MNIIDNFMIILCSFLVAIFHPCNTILILLLIRFFESEKTKERNFLKNLSIVFLMGFGIRLLFIPLDICAYSVEHQYFGIDTAIFVSLIPHAIVAVVFYLMLLWIEIDNRKRNRNSKS